MHGDLSENPVERELREVAYTQVFSPVVSVFHEMVPSPVHIDVYRFEWGEPRNDHGYVTGGMSDALQPGGGQFSRIELVFYAKKHDELYPKLLQTFAHYPWQTGASLGPWHTIPLGANAEKAVGSPRFAALLFFPGVAKPETPIHIAPQLASFGIRYMTVVPITAAELELTFKQGTDALIERFSQAGFDLAFDPERASVV
jgi:hypothetical protein